MNKFKILSILLFITLGCKSYDDRFSAKDYKETKGEIEHDEIRYYDINGTRKKAKKLEYDKNDILRKETFFRENYINKIRLYDKRGRITVEENFDKKNNSSGYRIIYYNNGNIREEYDFLNEDKNGSYNSYYSDGTLQSNQEFLNGQLKGSCSWYYPTGELMRIKEFLTKEYYKIEYYRNGNKKSEGSMRLNNLNNVRIIADSYSGDSFVGHWIFYNEHGNIIREEDY